MYSKCNMPQYKVQCIVWHQVVTMICLCLKRQSKSPMHTALLNDYKICYVSTVTKKMFTKLAPAWVRCNALQ